MQGVERPEFGSGQLSRGDGFVANLASVLLRYLTHNRNRHTVDAVEALGGNMQHVAAPPDETRGCAVSEATVAIKDDRLVGIRLSSPLAKLG